MGILGLISLTQRAGEYNLSDPAPLLQVMLNESKLSLLILIPLLLAPHQTLWPNLSAPNR